MNDLTGGPAADVEEKDMDVQQAVGAVTMWAGAENIWKARAACVAMLTWADKKEELFDGFRDVLLQTAAINIQNQERFVQLGTGTLLHRHPQDRRQVVYDTRVSCE